MIDLIIEQEIFEYVNKKKNAVKWNKLPQKYDEYLKQRFNDNTTNLAKESYCRLKYNIEQIPLCPICGNKLTFTNCKLRPYKSTCSKKCAAQLRTIKSKQTKLERYGDENYFNREKAKQTSLKKYGTEYPQQSKVIQDKIKKTSLKKYGTERPQQSKIVQDKIKQTCLEKYGVTNPGANEEIKKKIKQHFINTYGVESSWQIPEVQEKSKQTKIERYNDPTFTNPEKMKQTCLKKYGVDNGFKTKEAQEKYKQTCLERYGVDHNWKIPGEHDLTHTPEALEKKKQTSLKHYGVEHPHQSNEIKNKVNETKRKNNTFNSSSNEEQIYNILLTKFNPDNIIKNYKSELYPFNCDFYIKSLNMYIEYQGLWTHGNIPFDKNNIECQNKLAIWTEKAKTSQYYKNAIYNWTIRDVNKRNYAKENNLNWHEFFNYNDFKKWFDTL